MHVIATAGHVDHGKSALVRALTGMEPDRWAEERRRGMTIDLGFAWTHLPGCGPLAFVDVPGHEKLVGNMLAGVGPVPAVLLVVAADQGWQAQSEEHLAVLHALGVRHGVLAVSRSDLADPGPACKDALARIAASSLGTVEAVAVSALTGAGLGELRAALVRLTGALPAPDRGADVRLWVDRAFTVRGRGTVVTGTLGAGRISVGDHLALTPDSRPIRVRGLQTLKEDHSEVAAVARVAVNLHGVGLDRVRRGSTLLAPGRWLAGSLVDVRLRGDPAAELPRALILHIGSATTPVRVRPLGRDTARLSLAHPLPLRVGDTALLRDPGLHRIPAGITVLDVRPPRLAGRGAAAARAAALAALTGAPDARSHVRRRGLVHRAELLAMGFTAPGDPVAGQWLADPGHWKALRRSLVEAVDEHAARYPTDPGMPTDSARQLLGLPERSLVEALVQAEDEPALQQHDGRVYGSTTRPTLPPHVAEAVAAVRAELSLAPFQAPEAHRLHALGLTAQLLTAAVAAGALMKITDGIVLLPGADAEAAAILTRLEQPFTTSEARCALDSTRRVVVPLLEHLDRQGYTVRLDNLRRHCRPARSVRPGGGQNGRAGPPDRT